MAMASPCAAAMPRRPTEPAPCRNWSAQIAPAPKKISAKVPMNSAVNFWASVYIGASDERRRIVDEEVASDERRVESRRRKWKGGSAVRCALWKLRTRKAERRGELIAKCDALAGVGV